ncbi:hypothetical protein CYMTET_22326 [Cymbomonas tetramitiformis]|uniref:Uncharacterized protein n=1 Tax=Cymbomonas tetramitiformis TaxID=36881 RepID=A0AAE0G105_9CHLO|nr:hypothetical protein CYMTET_22326 [Cymbomonas tetramitiformis]
MVDVACQSALFIRSYGAGSGDVWECGGCWQFSIEDGYWIASLSVMQACSGENPECVFMRVYECANQAACTRETPEGAHINEVQLDICAEGYSSSVVLCDACEVGFMRGFAGSCKACPGTGLMVFGRMFGVLLILVCALVLVRWLIRRYLNSVNVELGMTDLNTVSSHGMEMNSASSGITSILSGWLQAKPTYVLAVALLKLDVDHFTEQIVTPVLYVRVQSG